MLKNDNLNDGDLNPKVQIELEKLNTASVQINEFENKLQELRNAYYDTLTKCSSNLIELSNKLGSVIPRARPYFELKRAQIEIQKESQIAASRYDTACVLLNHANSVVTKSESSARETSKLDDSAMEILNIAISKVNSAKKEQIEAHQEHQKYLNMYMDLDQKIHDHERKHKNDIRKSKDYFHYCKSMDEQLKEDKLNIEIYEEKVKICKSIYNTSLQRLEDISNQIHEERKMKEMLGPRGEGVGAEIDVIMKDDEDTSSYTAENDFELRTSPKSHNDTLDNDISISTTNTSMLTYSNSSVRKTCLVSSTPIVDGLLKAVKDNKNSFFYGTNKQLYRSFPRHTHSKMHIKIDRISTETNTDDKGDHM